MKTIKDFKIIDGIAVLEGVSYAEEAKVVDEFLKNNPNVRYASIYTKDNRYFELKENNLFFTKEKTFENPYYDSKEETIVVESKNDDDIGQNNLEKRVLAIESTLLSCYKTLHSLVKKFRNE